MPIAVEGVPPAQFAAWVASKGGTMPGAPAASAEASAAPSTDTDGILEPTLVNATQAAVPVEQAATSNPGIAE